MTYPESTVADYVELFEQEVDKRFYKTLRQRLVAAGVVIVLILLGAAWLVFHDA